MMNSTFFRSTIQCFYGSHQPRLDKAQALVRAIMRTLRSVGSAVHQPPIPGRKLSFLEARNPRVVHDHFYRNGDTR